MARAHAYFFYGSDIMGRDSALERAISDLAPRFICSFGEEKSIGIDDVHEIQRKSSLSTGDGTQAFVMRKVDMMSHEAAEALLKTLEEPSPGSIFFLVADSIDIPATLLSRVVAKPFFTNVVSGSLAVFEQDIRKTGIVSRERADRMRRQARIDILNNSARISAQSLVEFKEICHE